MREKFIDIRRVVEPNWRARQFPFFGQQPRFAHHIVRLKFATRGCGNTSELATILLRELSKRIVSHELLAVAQGAAIVASHAMTENGA